MATPSRIWASMTVDASGQNKQRHGKCLHANGAGHAKEGLCSLSTTESLVGKLPATENRVGFSNCLPPLCWLKLTIDIRADV